MKKKIEKVPSNTQELLELKDLLYQKTSHAHLNHEKIIIKGLLEIIKSEPNIRQAVEKLKKNVGSNTPGVDNKVIREYLNRQPEDLIGEIREKLDQYNPDEVRRVFIPKTNGKLRPLGIPTIIDRIIQECVRSIIEPILEAQMFKHSYGFRQMRDAKQAVTRIAFITYTTNCNWVIEGDIKGFFDNINHNVMIDTLYSMGICDKRVLMIIKQMLKAGVMNEISKSELGTPQGGIISPLLANAYLTRFDNYITREWENKKIRKSYSRPDGIIKSLKERTNLKQCYLVRYADDWVILTDSKENAEKLKYKAQKYLKETLKVELSEEKTHITNVKKKAIHFLGVEIKLRKGKNNQWVNHITPDRERFEKKVKEIKREIYYIRKTATWNETRLVENIYRVNSMILGLINYYDMADGASLLAKKYAYTIKYTAYKSLKRYGGKWVRANEVDNLLGLHYGHKAHIPAIKHNGKIIGLTSLEFMRWKKPLQKNPKETPYSKEGRHIYLNRVNKTSMKIKVDEINNEWYAHVTRLRNSEKYNFDYYINRPHVYMRDKGICKICGLPVQPNELNVHHIKEEIPNTEINKMKNLITTHNECHRLLKKTDEDLIEYPPNVRKNVKKYQNKMKVK